MKNNSYYFISPTILKKEDAPQEPEFVQDSDPVDPIGTDLLAEDLDKNIEPMYYNEEVGGDRMASVIEEPDGEIVVQTRDGEKQSINGTDVSAGININIFIKKAQPKWWFPSPTVIRGN